MYKFIPDSDEKERIWQESALNLSQAKPTPKQRNLNKLSDGDGSQRQWLPDAAKNLLFTRVRYNLAIVGATGAVGQEMLKVLERRDFPIKKLRCFASKRSAGKTVDFRGEKIVIEELSAEAFQGIDFALFSAGKKVSREFAPLAAKEGAIVVDNSSAFRMQAPLIIPEVNPHAALTHQGILSCPNCTAAIMLMALAPLHRQFKIERIVAATYQAASGAGAIAMHELEAETKAHFEQKPFNRTVMPFPYAFNLFTHNAPMTDSGYNDEEIKVIQEIHKILEDDTVRIAITCVRVPILRAHSMALNVEFENDITPEAARLILQQSPGVIVLEDWKQNRFPMPIDATGKDEVFVGRIRKDLSQPKTLDLWVVGDQLLKGAALNTIQIAEHISTSN